MVLLLPRTGCFQSATRDRTCAWLHIPVGSKGAENDPDVSEELSQELLSTVMDTTKLDIGGFMADVKVAV